MRRTRTEYRGKCNQLTQPNVPAITNAVPCVQCGKMLDWDGWWEDECPLDTQGHNIRHEDIGTIAMMPKKETP